MLINSKRQTILKEFKNPKDLAVIDWNTIHTSQMKLSAFYKINKMKVLVNSGYLFEVQTFHQN